MDLLAALRGKTEQAEVYTVEAEATQISFEANQMKSAEVEETQGIALRGLVDGRLGFTAAGGQVAQEELIANLLASAQYGDRLPITFPAGGEGPRVQTYDPALADVPISRFVEIGREIVEALLEVDEDVQVSVDIERGVYRSALWNSAGAETHDQTSSFDVSVSVERVREDDVLMVYDSLSEISFSENYRPMVERLADKIELAKRSARLTSGRVPVLFSPWGAMVLMLPIILALDGQNVQRGTSPLADRVGQQVFDPAITLWDDPTLAGRPSSSSHDDEGVPCYRKALLVKGACQGFLYDLKTAALMGTQSTGNGSRSLFSLPSPSPSNLILEGGPTPFRDLLAGIDHGLLVDDVLGLGQGNAISGAFSNTLGLAYVIERGEIVGRVKDVSIAGNIYEHLRQVAAISSEAYWVDDDIRLPYILLPELNVVCQGC